MHRLSLQIIVFAALILSGLSTALAQAEDAEKTHFTITQVASGPLIDEAISMLEAAYSKLGYTIEYEFLQSELALQKSNEGLADGEMVRVVGIEKNYPNLIPVPVPYLVAENVLFASEDWGKEVNEWDDLIPIINDQTGIGVRAGLKKAEQQLISRNIPYTETKTTGEAMEMLSEGRLKLVYEERRTGLAIIKKLGLKNIKVLEPPLDSVALYHYVHKSNGSLVPKLKKAFREIIRGSAVKEKGISLTKEEQAWLDEGHTVRVRVTHWPPLTFNFPDVEGVSIDYWEQFAEQFGIDSEYWITDMPFAEAYKDLTGDNELYDLHLTLKRTPDRLEKLAMTKHYFAAPWVIIAPKDRDYIKSIEDLNGRVVAIEMAYALVDLIRDNFPSIELKFYDTTEEAIDSVAVNETDAYVGNLARSLYHINQNSLINLQVAGRTPFGRHQQAMAMRKDWAPLATLFDKWLNTLSSVERNSILNKWVAAYEGLKPKSDKWISLTEEEKEWMKKHPVVRYGVDPAWPPFEWIDENGRHIGMTADYLKQIEQMTGLKFELVPGISWNEVLEGLQDGSVDMNAGLTYTPDREHYLTLTSPYLPFTQIYMVRSGKGLQGGLKAYAGRKVGTTEGYSIQHFLEKNYPDLDLALFKTPRDGLTALATGKIDAFAGNLAVLTYLAQRNNLTNLEVGGEVEGVARAGLRMGARKELPELVSILDKALAAIPAEEHLSISHKWGLRELQREKAGAVIALTEEETGWLTDNPITLSVDDRYAPMNFRDTDGSMVGLSIDYIQMIEKKLGVSINLDTRPWPQALANAMEHKTDGIINAKSTPERAEKLLFTSPFIEAPMALFTRSEAPVFQSIEALNGKRILVKKKTAEAALLPKKYPAVEIVEVDSYQEALSLLSTGSADAVFGHLIVVEHEREKNYFANIKVNYLTFDEIVTAQRIGVRNDRPLLLSVLNKAILAITEQEHRTIRRKWVSTPLENETTTIDLTSEEREWLKKHPIIKVGHSSQFEPMLIRDPIGRITGMLPDYYEKVRKLLGVQIEFIDDKWPEILRRVQDKEIDVVGQMNGGVAKKKGFLTTPAPFISLVQVFAGKNRDFEIESDRDLDGLRVAYDKNKIFLDNYLDARSDRIELLKADSPLEALKLVLNNKADVMIGFRNSAYLLSKYSLTDLEPVHALGDIKLNVATAVRSDAPLLASILYKAFSAISRAEKDEIISKWLLPPERTEAIVSLTAEERAWIKAHPKIRVHNETEWPPFNFYENGKPKGFSIDFMGLVAKKTGLEVDYVTGPSWNEFLEMMKRGDLDVMLNIVKTPERLKYLLYTPSYADNPNVILSKKEKPYKSVKSLLGKTVAIPKGFFTEEILKREYPQITVLPRKNMLESMKAVSFGQADAALGELAVFNHLLNQHMMTDMSVSGEAHLGDPELSLLHIATRKEQPVLSSILTKGVEAVTQEERGALLAKWSMQEEETPTVGLTAQIPLTKEEQAWIKAHPVIKVSNEMDWRPFDFNENGVPSGYSIDLMKLLAERTGIQLEFVHGPGWDEFLSALKEKRIDILLSAAKTEDREKYSLFTDPYIQTINRFIVHKDSPEIRDLSDLKGKTFAAPKGWASLEYLKKNRPDIKLLETDSVYDAFNAVMLGKADATAERDKVARYFMSYYGLSDLKISSWFRELDQNRASGLHVMVRDDWPVLRGLLDKALASLTVQEKLALESRWFGEASVTDDEAPVVSEDIVFDQATLLIKWIAVAFAILVLLMFVYWLAKGRPTQFTIGLTLLYISAVFAGLIVAIGLLVMLLLRGEQRQEAIENNRYESIQLAYELKQSSDDLTRFARTYVVTGDPKYEEYFRAIIRIRDGKQAHPKGYSHVYWDQVSAGLVEHNAEGETYSIEQRMVELGMSDEEISMLRQSKYASDDLIKLEDIAMNMVRGVYYKDYEDRFTVTTKPNMALAAALLHGEKYHTAKANIMQPINEVFVLLKKRTEKELQTERANNKAILLVIAGMIILTIAFSAYTYVLFRRRMVKPLEILKGGALRIEGGDYLHQITVDSQDEMGDLGRAFNAMAGSVHERTHDLRAAMEQLELALSAADAGTFIHDYEHDVVKLDERACHHLAFRKNETTFKQFFDNIHPEDAPGISQLLKSAFVRKQKYITVEFRSGVEEHENTHIEVQALIQYDSQTGKPNRSIGVIFDITERKKVEEEVRSAKQRLEDVFIATRDLVYDWNLVSDDLITTPNYYKILGYEPEDFPEKTGASMWIDVLHPDDRDATTAEFEHIIEQSVESYSLEFRMRCKDGSYKWFFDRGHVAGRDKEGNVTRLIGSLVDIDSYKELQKQLNDAKEEAEAANKSKSSFLASMSHELRTPLNAVLGFSQLMHSDKTLNEQQRGNLDIINNSGKHLLQLINDVLDMSKIEAGKIDLMPEDMDLGELVRDVIEMLQVRAEQKGLRLIYDQSSDVPRFVRADGPKIRQVLINLLSNSIKFTDTGGVTLRLAVKNAKSDTITLLGEVQDTGRGIDAEDLERIFQPFEQLAASVEQKGTGLGLAITRQFVELMGGEVSAASQPGEGTTFYFSINVEPGNPEQVHAAGADVEARTVMGLQEPAQEWRILIVEDNPENQLLLEQILVKVGFQVRIAEDGEKGVTAFEEWHPHFIWMDRRMPRMDGLEATRRIRELPGGKDVTIVALTASVFQEQRDEVMSAGSDEIVNKPYRPAEIFDCMARYLGLQYVYEEEEIAEVSPQTVDVDTITPERIASLPADVRVALGKAATRLDIDQAGAVLKQIEEVDPELAAALTQLVDRLDFYAIKKLLS